MRSWVAGVPRRRASRPISVEPPPHSSASQRKARACLHASWLRLHLQTAKAAAGHLRARRAVRGVLPQQRLHPGARVPRGPPALCGGSCGSKRRHWTRPAQQHRHWCVAEGDHECPIIRINQSVQPRHNRVQPVCMTRLRPWPSLLCGLCAEQVSCCRMHSLVHFTCMPQL